jgi:two-component system cell cycle sensor histidine kinase PleC
MKEQIFGPLADRYREYVCDIHGSGTHLLDLINELLDTAKIKAGHLEYHEEPVCLREILDEAIRLTRLSGSDCPAHAGPQCARAAAGSAWGSP